MLAFLAQTKEVEVKGVKFEIRIIPALKWFPIEKKLESSIESARKHAKEIISKNPNRNDDPKNKEEELEYIKKIFSQAFSMMSSEERSECEVTQFYAFWEIVKNGLVSFSGLKDFKYEEELKPSFDSNGLIEDSIIDLLYRKKILMPLGTLIKDFQDLSEEQEKN